MSPPTARVPRALSIAGSDSGGGAGIQADLKTFTALGVFGATVITALTAQNTLGVQAVHVVPTEFVAAQFDSVLSDIGCDAAKTGMLAAPELIEVVAAKVQAYGVRHLVVDPVLVAKGGDVLVGAAARAALQRRLLPLATVVTPNRHEAEALSGRTINDLKDMQEAARAICDQGARAVVVKGAGLTADAADLFYDGKQFQVIMGRHLPTTSTHGTGCTFSAAITAGLARGLQLLPAIQAAKRYITAAIGSAPGLGGGRGPVNHMHGQSPF